MLCQYYKYKLRIQYRPANELLSNNTVLFPTVLKHQLFLVLEDSKMQIATGCHHSVVLKKDGTVVAWGR
jgi:alpha-tubulin suppressor-like RCC1 family protein